MPLRRLLATPDSLPRRAPVRRRLGFRLAAVALVVCAQGLKAQAQSGEIPGIVRDAEIEQLMRDYATPVLRAAGVNTTATKIVLINDRSFNAFVANGQKIFINLGALLEAKTPNELIGVLAHESGHIAGGHLSALHQEMAHAQLLSIVGALAGAGALVATSRANRPGSNVGSDSAGQVGLILGPQELVRRSLLSYIRAQEEAADRAAVKYLSATGQSSRGLLTTLQRFQSESLFKTQSIDPYTITHPLPRERIQNLEEAVKTAAHYNAVDPPALQQRHDLARAKLVGFMGNASEVGRRYPVSDSSLPARYARAVSAYRVGRQADALTQIEGLLASQPANPYFHELKGQVLLEGGRPREAITPLRRAAALAPSGYPIRAMLGHALVAADQANEAVGVLTKVAQLDPEDPESFQYLAMAYDRKGETSQAQLAAAQGFFLQGKFVEARTQADRAKKQFKEGSPGWLKADDILNYRPPIYN